MALDKRSIADYLPNDRLSKTITYACRTIDCQTITVLYGVTTSGSPARARACRASGSRYALGRYNTVDPFRLIYLGRFTVTAFCLAALTSSAASRHPNPSPACLWYHPPTVFRAKEPSANCQEKYHLGVKV